ncbi:MAG: VIT1/CCC1 transporter family protein [Alphaproteobacteria bacterium]|nr:VIT1/CCC1 transporter family protein [Alphaproteobacteria bacterium]
MKTDAGARLQALGRRIPRLGPGFHARALGWLARRFGSAFVLPTINTLGQLDSGSYDKQPEAVAGGLPGAERSHARVLAALAAPLPGAAQSGGIPGSSIALLEGRHRGASGNALRAAILGANDGLVSNLSLVMGVAGAVEGDRTILITGLAGLIAGACSMALGEWLSVNSSRELAQKQIAAESDELQAMPEEEQEELALIYQAKGLSEAQAKALAERLIADKSQALDTLVREELGIDPTELGGSAWVAAGTSFCLFSLGAIFPVAPYFFLHGNAAVTASMIASAAALLATGAISSLFTGRGVVFAATRQLLVGAAAAAITYGLGRLLGVSLGG